MKNLQDATERICDLKGSLVALDALLPALLETLPESVHDDVVRSFEAHAEAARTVMLHTDISDLVLAAFERDVARNRALLAGSASAPGATVRAKAEAVLLTTTRVGTFIGPRPLTGASGFFFRRDDRLFLVTNRHVLLDEPSGHRPDRIEIELHTDAEDLTRCAVLSILLYDREGHRVWRQASDTGGEVDVAAIEIDRAQLPRKAVLEAFDDGHLDARGEAVAVGDALTVVGFPLGFHDTVHHLAVARSASIASAYGVRFQRQGYFLTDARTHRGSSGAPVLRSRRRRDGSPLPWQLLGVHSTRMDMRTRDRTEDESLGLNCVWYADVLRTLTDGTAT
jgi:S1-C subfamily serine protease